MILKEELARKYSGCYLSPKIPCSECTYYNNCHHMKLKDAVLYGIDLAEEWTHVTCELPEINKEKLLVRVEVESDSVKKMKRNVFARYYTNTEANNKDGWHINHLGENFKVECWRYVNKP